MGIIEAISRANNTTAHNSGTALTATIIKLLMRDNWDNSNGEVATDLFMGSFLKNVVDAITVIRGTTIQVDANAKAMIDVVDKITNGYGTLNLHLHRYVQQSTDATGRILGVRPEKLAIAYLKRPYIQSDLSVTGPFVPRAIVGALTLRVINRQSNFFASGFDID